MKNEALTNATSTLGFISTSCIYLQTITTLFKVKSLVHDETFAEFLTDTCENGIHVFVI